MIFLNSMTRGHPVWLSRTCESWYWRKLGDKTDTPRDTNTITLCPQQRCADCRRGYPRTWIRRFSCGRGWSVDLPNKHVCGRGPSADLKPRQLFAGPTSNGSANVPVLISLRTDPYLDTAVGYVFNKESLFDCVGP